MILGLRSAIYPVGDIAAAKAWYEKVLERKPYFDEPFYVGFEVGGFELGLIPDGAAATSGARPFGVWMTWMRHWRGCSRLAQALLSRSPMLAEGSGWQQYRTRLATGSELSRIQTSIAPPCAERVAYGALSLSPFGL
jgi:hypothetical protein